MVSLERTGIAVLPLHTGRAPVWLVKRMKKLGEGITTLIIDEYGTGELLKRLANPVWFQAFGSVLGYDWNSSGLTTVLSGVLRDILKPEEFGVAVAGGKGKRSLRTLDEITQIGKIYDLSEGQINFLRYASRIVAKVDNALIQDGYQLYHHSFFVTEDGEWAVIQQGMCTADKTARRYHWLSNKVASFVKEPHEGIVGDVVKEDVLNMTSKKAAECQRVSVDLVGEGARRIKRDLLSLRPVHQRTLEEWIRGDLKYKGREPFIHVLRMPRSVDWDALKKAYEVQPSNYEELISIKGIGSATVRALALISEIIYGAPADWEDPVRYSFAIGGKNGVPFPVDRKVMDESTEFLRHAVEDAKLGKNEKLSALRNLMGFVSWVSAES